MAGPSKATFGASSGDHVRPAASADVPALTEIAHEAKRHWGYPEEWIETWGELLTLKPQDLAAQDVFIAESAGTVVGFCSVSRQGDSWDVEHMWVHPGHMGRNVGRTLMVCAIRHISRQGGRVLTIESDPHAEGFYLRLGARRIGEVPAHMGTTRRFLPLLELSIR